MADGGQKSGILDLMRDKEGSGLYIVNPKKSETASGEPGASELRINR